MPAPAEVARAALDANSIDALRKLQRRENEAWQARSEISLAWPAVGLGVGSLLTPIMVPLGSVLLVAANQSNEYTGIDDATDIANDERRRRAGSVLLAIGLTAVATVVYCSLLVHRRRHAKRSANQELVAVRVERTHLLETLTPSADARTP